MSLQLHRNAWGDTLGEGITWIEVWIWKYSFAFAWKVEKFDV